MAKELIKSDRTIQALKPGAGRLSDGAGLYLLPFLKGAGSHCWRVDYTHEGKRKTISLGVYPQVGLALARERAGNARVLVAAGGNPSQDRKETRAVIAARNEAERRVEIGESAIGSFEEVARRWFATKEDGWVESYSSKIIARLERHVFPYLGNQPIRSIGAKELLEVCRRIEDQGTREAAYRALEHCSNVFRFAIAEGTLTSDPCRDLKGALKLTGRSGFVFPAEGRPGRTMSDGTVNAALSVLGYPSDVMTGHGFPATARTLILEVLGIDKEVAEMQLSHAVEDDNGVAYNRAEFILKRQAMMQAWADYLEDLRLDRSTHQSAVLPEFKPVTLRLARPPENGARAA